MKILHLNTYSAGGSYEYAALLSRALMPHGVTSTVFCREPLSSPSLTSVLSRIARKIDVSASKETWHGTWRFLPAPSPTLTEDVDVVHLHTVGDWFNVARWLEKLPVGVAVVVSLHDLWHVSGGCFVYKGCEGFVGSCTPCPVLHSPLDGWFAKRELTWKTRIYGERRVAFVANSEWLSSLAERSVVAGKCTEMSVIPPAIDTSIFKPLNKMLCRQTLGLPLDTFLIATGCAALTDTYKNTPWLLATLAKLPNLENAAVVAFGDGLIAAPESLNVYFTGPIKDRSKLAMILSAADVFISASIMDTYGLTLVEAMACGTPVVAFRVGGIPEAAVDGEASILCNVMDEGAILDAIARLRSSKGLRASLGEAGTSIARTRNSPEAFAQTFYELYQKCVAS